MKWSRISSTLISGKRDAVLVDTAITVDQNQKLVDWIAHSGKHLTAIYATHGHGDHFFGVNTIQKKFPKARFVATSEVIAVMRKQASVPVVESYWKPRFPGQIDSTLLIADELKDGVLDLEGKQLISVPLGHTDTDSTTCLHVPSIGLAVCGDALYNDVGISAFCFLKQFRQSFLCPVAFFYRINFVLRFDDFLRQFEHFADEAVIVDHCNASGLHIRHVLLMVGAHP